MTKIEKTIAVTKIKATEFCERKVKRYCNKTKINYNIHEKIPDTIVVDFCGLKLEALVTITPVKHKPALLVKVSGEKTVIGEFTFHSFKKFIKILCERII